MTIVYHHRTFADGAEGIHIAEMVDAFQALGHTVKMVSIARPRGRGEGHEGVLTRVRRRLPAWLFELAAVGYSIVDMATFAIFLRRERPDFVYKRHALNDFGVLAAARLCGVPTVLEVNCPYSSPKHREFEHVQLARIARLSERYALRLATLVITVSTPLRDYLVEVGSRPADTLTVPNGANPVRFAPPVHTVRAAIRQELRLTGPVVGWVGILRRWHGLDLLVEAATQVPDATFLIIGDGPDREPLESMIANLGLQGRVILTGRVASDAMSRYLAAVDVAVASADRTGYASPMKILEYMAMALPTVAPRSRNIEDIVRDGQEGLLFTPGDSADLGRAIRQLISSPEIAVRMGQTARRTVEEARNWKAIARHVLDELEHRK